MPVIFTSVFFGLTHFINIDSLDELLPIAVNAAFAIVFGVVLGIIYVLSGTIWPTIIVHSVYDIALMCMEYSEDSPDWPTFVDIAGTVVLMIFLIIVFQKNKDKVTALWNKKWNNQEQKQEA